VDPLYVTTAIPFVNAPPHVGHALELVHADVIARHARARGRPVRLVTGTDEHAPKNARAAAAAGEEVRAFVARHAARFRELAGALGVAYDDFLRTSADPRHRTAVEWVWARCAERGDLVRRTYEGLYCGGCEEFVDGACGEHDALPEPVVEENWFFRLSRYGEEIRGALDDARLRIVPRERAREVRAVLDAGLRDISVSRPRERARGWGIPVPRDPEQVVYVWFDALVNYLSALGLGTDDRLLRTWWRGGERRHVVGKGIVRFHAVVWPAMLAACDLPLPSTLFVHDYVTASGRKIGKSLGNAVDPVAVAQEYGVDALRWWLLREVPRLGEADFSEARLVATADRDLAHGVGNLVARVAALAAPGAAGRPAAPPLDETAALPAAVDAAVDDYDLRAACVAVLDAVAAANRALARSAPWAREGRARERALAPVLASTRIVVDELAPFVPGLAARARARLAGVPGPVFPRLTPARGHETSQKCDVS
jgi:methionyl-tRNA synthetase